MIGEKLGSFRIEAVLGTGAMGVVYRAISEATGRPAAVKVIGGEIAQKGKTYERFRRESEILQSFRHPNIVRFLALGKYKGTAYFAMEYVAGENLEQMLQRKGALPWRDVVELGIQVCEALHYAHEHSVVHRDLKPSNLMVSAKGQIKLTDFGIAKDLDATALTATGRTLGTAAYMAPEQIRGTPAVSHKTDLYALGVVLYQMLVGSPPYEGSSAVVLMHKHLNEPVPRPSAKVAEIPVALDKLVMQLLAKDPVERPWDAAAVAAALNDLREKAGRGESIPMVWPAEGDTKGFPSRLGGDPPKAAKKSAAKRNKQMVGRSLDRSTLEIALLLLGLVAVGGLLGYLLWPPSQAYLYRQAERLMASKDRHDWITATEDYLDPLDRNYPNNPYRETTKGWRDRLALSRAKTRSTFLETDHVAPINKPDGPGEESYQAYFHVARKASEEGDDLRAIQYWNEMVQKLSAEGPEQRGWILLAQERAAELRRSIELRRQIVLGLIERLDKARLANRTMEAARISADLLLNYKRYTDLAEVFQLAGLNAAADEPPSPVPGATPAPAPKQATDGAEPPPQPAPKSSR